MISPIEVVGFSDPGFFNTGWGKLLTTPTIGGAAVLLAAVVAFVANAWSIRANRVGTEKTITAARAETDKKIAADRADTQCRLDAARTEATAARTQVRRADAYVSIIEVTERVGLWVRNVHRPFGDQVPALPDTAEQAKARAQLLAFATADVRESWTAWEETAQRAVRADATIRRTEATIRDHGRDPETARGAHQRQDDAQDELEQIRALEHEHRRVLLEMMNAELAERLE